MMDEALDNLRFMMGHEAGSLARVMDLLTDVMAQVNQHVVYCRVEKGPRAGEAPMDVAMLLSDLEQAKILVQETLQRLREDR